MRFGRSRVQDRARDSDERFMSVDGPGQVGDSATGVGSRGLAPDGPSDSGYAIDALRAYTTAAGTQYPPRDFVVPGDLAPTHIAQIRRLHEASLEAARRTRGFPKPRSRRKLQDAQAAEASALHAVGYTAFAAFAAVYGPTPSRAESESDETVTRIRALLNELGVDPGGDPLRAASDFLTTHESEDGSATELSGVIAGASDPFADRGIVEDWVAEHMTTANAETGVDEPASEPEGIETVTAEVPHIEPARVEVARVEPAHIEPAHIEPAHIEPPHIEVTPVETAPTEPRYEEPARVRSDATNIGVELPHELDLEAEAEPEAPWVPAAQFPTPTPPLLPPEVDSTAGHRIHAEARAERMHSEVDRAQAELAAMLAKSVGIDPSAETHVEELDAANSELDGLRRRVSELEQSIVRSGSARAEIERALSTSRDHVSALEATLLEREHSFTQSTLDRTSALDRVAALERTLSAGTSELDDARTKVAALEVELFAQSAQLDATRGELDVVRAHAEELNTELETTRRSLDALDAHAEAIEAELADARRATESPDARRELEAVRQELAEAQRAVAALESRRVEGDRALTSDLAELDQLQRALETAREETGFARQELAVLRRAVDETVAQIDEAERARDAITIDAADLLARAEAEATNLLERANRDAETIRQEAVYGSGSTHYFDDETLRSLVDQVERLERKVAKQKKRLDRLVETTPDEPESVATAAEIRRAAQRDREQFRSELLTLVTRLAPLAAETDEFDEFEDADDLDDGDTEDH